MAARAGSYPTSGGGIDSRAYDASGGHRASYYPRANYARDCGAYSTSGGRAASTHAYTRGTCYTHARPTGDCDTTRATTMA